jgi:peptidoglycan L-alanyl-D-glutamate endopeptidase CwlK
MINSRKIEDLHPHVASLCRKFIERCKEAGVDVLVTSTYRDHESQNALYAQGRTAPGKIVTKAKGGQSFHNHKVAFDVVPLVNGKAIWNDEGLWRKIGQIGQEVGLEWGGNWKFQDKPHFQYTGGLTLADFQAGKALTETV